MTTEQIFEAFKILKSKGAKEFGIHAFLASNTVTNEYYPTLAKILFELAVELKEKTGADIKFINLSGGIGVDYKPEQEKNDISIIGACSCFSISERDTTGRRSDLFISTMTFLLWIIRIMSSSF